MQIIENWSRLSGRVEAWEPPRLAGEPGTLTIAVERVEDVITGDGSAHRNLLSDAAGTSVQVIVPARAAERLAPRPGWTVVVEVRRGKYREPVFAHPTRIVLTP